MLAATRKFAKSWVAAVLIGLLIVSFAVFGINDVFRAGFKDAVITAGSRTVTTNDFRREFDAQKRQLEAENRRPIPTELLVERGMDKQLLQAIATREAFAAMVTRLGILPSDKLVVGEIAKVPAFFDRVSGRFDKNAYQQQLAQANLTTEQFEQMARDDIATRMAVTGVVAGARAPLAYSALAGLLGLEARDVAYFAVTPQMAGQPAAPTDAQLQAFMRENAAQLTRPELRVLTLVQFAPTAADAAGPVDAAAVRKLYDFRKDTLSTPETRTVVQIPAKDQAAAQAIATRLQKGESPAAVAQSLKVDAITYDNRPQTAIPDRQVGVAAFKLAAGQVAPVQSGLGWQVVKVIGVTPGRVVTFEEARPQLEAEVRRTNAVEKVLARTQAYEEAHTAGANLAEAARRVNVPTVTLGPITQDGRTEQNQTLPALDPRVLETAFGLPAGGESDLVELGEGQYFAVRVERIMPPSLPPMTPALRAELARVWTGRETLKRMEARAEALAARVRKGEAINAVAASAGAQVQRTAGLTRQSARETGLPQDLLQRAFSAKPNEAFTARGDQFAILVGRLDAVRPATAAQAAPIAVLARDQASVEMFRELEETSRNASRAAVKVKIDNARARAALGLEPEAPAGKAASKAGTKK
ncbi:peptidyl-prolyl cis-trans isomerase [Phenylobacterium sp.]|jgi:peptidyl-prolyl cis-trans isomerase D|uniref:peptidylprolyl isomerase n=1 Tax=Phenylobacterium sp. TaxID=1871053 RepID=UPI0037851472